MNKEESEIVIPSYLFEIAYGPKLQEEMSGSLDTFSSDEFKQQMTNKLAVLGILGTDPDHINPTQLKDIQKHFQNRIISTSTLNGNSRALLNVAAQTPTRSQDEPESIIDDQNKSKPETGSMIHSVINDILSENQKKLKYPLPSYWISLSQTASDALIFSNGALDVKLTNSPATKSYEYTCIKAQNTIPYECGLFYYEVTVVSGFKNADISIGFTTKDNNTPYTRMPGSDSGSFGYNGSEGAFYNIERNEMNTKFGLNDTIGCGVNYYNNTIFFTKNGIYLKPFADDIHFNVCPFVGMKAGNAISANFGTKEFKFNIVSYIRNFKLKIDESISEYSSDNLHSELKLNNDELNVPINAFIKNYFIHDGFVESAKGFKKDLEKESDVTLKSNSSKSENKQDDEIEDSHAVNRQIIREYILKGEIDLVIKFLNLNYADLLRDHVLLFDLKCQKLIQLISEGTSGENSTNLLSAISYGKSLQQEFNKDPDCLSQLNDISSLLAHKNPVESKFGFYLSSSRKLKLIDRLNKRILKNLGEYEVSMIEKIFLNTMTNLDILAEHQNNESYFINFEPDYMDF